MVQAVERFLILLFYKMEPNRVMHQEKNVFGLVFSLGGSVIALYLCQIL